MSGTLENVKVGDKIVVHTQYYDDIAVIERTTNTLVITNHYRFIKKSGKAQGCSPWSYVWASVASDKEIEAIEKRARRRNLIIKCQSTKFDSLTDSQLEAILKIVNQE